MACRTPINHGRGDLRRAVRTLSGDRVDVSSLVGAAVGQQRFRRVKDLCGRDGSILMYAYDNCELSPLGEQTRK